MDCVPGKDAVFVPSMTKQCEARGGLVLWGQNSLTRLSTNDSSKCRVASKPFAVDFLHLLEVRIVS